MAAGWRPNSMPTGWPGLGESFVMLSTISRVPYAARRAPLPVSANSYRTDVILSRYVSAAFGFTCRAIWVPAQGQRSTKASP